MTSKANPQDQQKILRRKFLTATAVVSSSVAITAHSSIADDKLDEVDRIANPREQFFGETNTLLAAQPAMNVKHYGAKGDGSTDDTEAINALLHKLGGESMQRVYFPPGQYRHAGIKIKGKSDFEIFGPGQLMATTATVDEYLKIENCNNFKVLGLQSRHEDPTARRSTPAHAFSFAHCADFEVTGCRAHSTEGVGLMLINSSHAVLRGNRVSRTKADGIGLYGDTHDVVVTQNTTHETLDDGIAQVGVTTQGVRPYNNRIFGNTVMRSYARGIAVVGAYNSTIIGNTVEFTRAAGIYIAAEPTRSTYGCSNVVVSGNIVLDANKYDPAIDQAAITVIGEAHVVEDVTVTDNHIRNARTEGIRVGGANAGTKKIALSGNRVSGTGSTGLEIWSVDDISIIGNAFEDLGSGGILGTSGLSGAVVVAGNTVRNPNTTGSSYAAIGMFEADAASIIVSANTVIDAKADSYGIDTPPQATVYGNNLNGSLSRGGAGSIELRGNISVSTSAEPADAAGGEGVLAVRNVSMAPTASPEHGGVLYVEEGALKYKGSAGTVTTLGRP